VPRFINPAKFKGIPGKIRRRWAGSAPSYYSDICKISFRRLCGSGDQAFHLLLISDTAEYTSEQQFAPLIRHKGALRKELGIVFRRLSLREALRKNTHFLERFDAVGLKLSFRSSQSKLDEALNHLNKTLDRKRTKTIYFDGDDDQSIQWAAALEWADLYVKKHAFNDQQQYQKVFYRHPSEIKINNLTDLVSNFIGGRTKHETSQARPLDPGHLERLHVGWNIALDDKIVELLQHSARPSPDRTIDIVCRSVVPPEAWITPLRKAALDAVNQLSDQFHILAPQNRVPQEEYYRELRQSRICVSPIGYGEICWRDFEAVLSGCLLVKPDIGYIHTQPNIYSPYKTYIPVRWDYSDLREQCAYYLCHENERMEIAENAYRALASALSEGWFLNSFSKMLERLNATYSKSQQSEIRRISPYVTQYHL
jgi:hypothetical protein